MTTVQLLSLLFLAALPLGNAFVVARTAWREEKPELGMLLVTAANSVVVLVAFGFLWDTYQFIFQVPVVLMVIAGLNLMGAVRLGLTLLDDE